MRARLAAHVAQVLAMAAGIALVNRFWLLAAGFTLVAVLPLYIEARVTANQQGVAPSSPQAGRAGVRL